jgi:hypothetical protein
VTAFLVSSPVPGAAHMPYQLKPTDDASIGSEQMLFNSESIQGLLSWSSEIMKLK